MHDFNSLVQFTSLHWSKVTPHRSTVARAGCFASTAISPSFCRMVDISGIVYQVREHLCGHAFYGDTPSPFHCDDI